MRYFLTAVCIMFLMALPVFAVTPGTISYQGVLTDGDGTPLPDGNYNLTFRLYEAEDAEKAVWEEGQLLNVKDGLVHAALGSVFPFRLSFEQTYWLGISVSAQQELLPRTELQAVPYSLNAISVSDRSITSPKISNNSVVRKIDVGGTSLQDNVKIVAGDNIAISAEGNSVVISAQDSGSSSTLAASDGDPADAVFVDAEGNVGVGTTTPVAKLQVRGDIAIDSKIQRFGDPGNSLELSSSFVRINHGSEILLQAQSSNKRVTLFNNARIQRNAAGPDTAYLDFYSSSSGSFHEDFRFAHGRGAFWLENGRGTNFSTITKLVEFRRSGNIFTVFGDAFASGGTWTASDRRYKENIKPVNGALGLVQKLSGVRYTMKRDEFKEMNFRAGDHIGVIAQDLEEVLPELVRTDKDGYKSVAYDGLGAVLLEAVKEQQEIIRKQESELNKVRAEMSNLAKRLQTLEQLQAKVEY